MINQVDFCSRYLSLQPHNTSVQLFSTSLPHLRQTSSSNLHTFEFVRSSPAFRPPFCAIKPRLHATSGFFLESVYLQLMTQQQNCKKTAKYLDYSFVAQNRKNRKCVKATNKNTNEVTYFKSMYAVKQFININPAIVKMVCDGIKYYKSGVSKKDGCSYTFEYVREDELPSNHKKSANTRPKRVSDEDKKKNNAERVKKWQNKEYKCPNCDKVYKNSYKYLHKKRCDK